MVLLDQATATTAWAGQGDCTQAVVTYNANTILCYEGQKHLHSIHGQRLGKHHVGAGIQKLRHVFLEHMAGHAHDQAGESSKAQQPGRFQSILIA